MSKSPERLEAWKVSMQLVKAAYDLTARFSTEERYGLSQQTRRAAVSIPSNIAEGAARSHRREYVQFLSISRGFLAELETQLKVAVMLGFARPDCGVFDMADRAGRLLTGMYRHWSKA